MIYILIGILYNVGAAIADKKSGIESKPIWKRVLLVFIWPISLLATLIAVILDIVKKENI